MLETHWGNWFALERQKFRKITFFVWTAIDLMYMREVGFRLAYFMRELRELDEGWKVP